MSDQFNQKQEHSINDDRPATQTNDHTASTKSTHHNQQRMAWYQEAKFGLFIHWGAYSVEGVEASWPIMAPGLSEVMFGTQTRISEEDYTALPARFNPVDFNAEVWVQIAQEAGMRYIVITSKHHDGFCMFDAPCTDYKITNTPFGRDICLELSQACASAGMPFGFYYSPPDMHYPGYRDTQKPIVKNWLGEPKRKEWGDYLDYMESHIRKLLTDYGDVKILWFDGLVNHGKYDPPRFHRLIHELSPDTLINDRFGDGYDFVTPEQFIPKSGIPVRTGKPPSGNDPGGDDFFRLVTFLFKVPILHGLIRKQLQKYTDGELELTPVLQEPYPSPDRFQPWETCMTMGKSWAHNPHETAWKEPRKLIFNLIDVVNRGGNYLLNVGPTAEGTFPPEAILRLKYVGRWMHVYQDAIFGCTYTPLLGLPWGQVTRKGNSLFLHVFHWPENNQLEIEAFPGKVLDVRLFSGTPLAFTCHEKCLAISLPVQAPDTDVSVLVVKIDETEAGWSDYSHPSPTIPEPGKYIRSQAVSSGVVNTVINGTIAFFTYRSRTNIPFAEVAIDVLITVAIISFLVGWFAIVSARKQLPDAVPVIDSKTREKSTKSGLSNRPISLPKNAALAALILSLPIVLIFGGLFLDGFIYLVSPHGLSNWAYIGVKTLYTGVCAALSSALAIHSVFKVHAKRVTSKETE